MPTAPERSLPSPFTVTVFAWLIPGGGYWLLGERARARTVGLTITLLFVVGLLVGGIRVLEVPGYGSHGRIMIVTRPYLRVVEESQSEGQFSVGPAMLNRPMDEIRAKPWSVAQVMTGTMGVVAGAIAVRESRLPGNDQPPPAVRSHSHINEIGTLYTAVAGMLNLLAIIDASYRAAQGDVRPDMPKENTVVQTTTAAAAPATPASAVTSSTAAAPMEVAGTSASAGGPPA